MTADAVGGVWTYALDLARALGARDIRVLLAVMGPAPSAAQQQDAGRIPALELHHRPYRLEWMENPWEDVAAAGRWLLELEQAFHPDVVHLNGFAHGSLPWNSPVVVVGHSCVLSWWVAVHSEEAPPRFARYAEAVARGWRAADLVVAPTAATMHAFERHYGTPARARVIPNGRALPVDRRGHRRYPASGCGGKEPLILTAGRLWDEGKNVEAVCSVAAALPWPVYVAGDGRVTSPAVRTLGVLSSSELAGWMARASIFALPARYEPFGLAPVEAALAGCALVLGDIRSLREVWGDAAIFVPPDNRRALSLALEALIDDEAWRLEMARRAATRARELTPERMADRYCEAYQTCDRRPVRAFAAV